jgi:hypothetical protein
VRQFAVCVVTTDLVDSFCTPCGMDGVCDAFTLEFHMF